jgi:hypothetical protein
VLKVLQGHHPRSLILVAVIMLFAVAVAVAVAGEGLLFGYQTITSGYYLGTEHNQVVIYKGNPARACSASTRRTRPRPTG